MGTLLGKFYSRIRGSQEDIASEALAYILQNSKPARLGLENLIRSKCEFPFDNLRYLTQGVGDKLERPDVIGKNDDGSEPLLIEAKFWANLTSNQPNTYLDRLAEQGVLLFLVPQERKNSIYLELKERVNPDLNPAFDGKEFRISFDGMQKWIIILSWQEVLHQLKQVLTADFDHQAISDIDQLSGYCNVVTKESFLPLADEDLAPIIPKRILGYFDLIDDVIDTLKDQDSDFSTSGLQRTASRNGYVRYFKYGNLGMALSVRYDFWTSHGDTPFWLIIKEIAGDNKYWQQTPSLLNSLSEIQRIKGIQPKFINEEYVFALYPSINMVKGDVLADLASKVKGLVRSISNIPTN